MTRKKETQAQKMKKMIKEVLDNQYRSIISGNTFTGIKFDAEILGTVSAIAEGLIENAKGLQALSGFLKASTVNISSLLSVDMADGGGKMEIGKGVRTHDTFVEEE